MFAAFTTGLLLITILELGDKTFFIAAILAVRYSRRLVFAGVIAALAAMTVLSVMAGKAASVLPQSYVHYAEIALFFGFGLKLLLEAKSMSAKSDGEEAQEAIAAVSRAESRLSRRKNLLGILLKTFVMTFVAEWGDRSQFTTIALAASNSAVGVTAGAILGHGICAAIAVLGGRSIAGRISERTITTIGGCLFLVFAAIALCELHVSSFVY